MADTRKIAVWPVRKGWNLPLKLYHSKNFSVSSIQKSDLTAGGWTALFPECISAQRQVIRFACLLQCLAIDAAENRVAAGDVIGRIIIWHGLRTALADVEAGREPRALYSTSLHWHSQAVACLTFSLDSMYLLSGGAEAVLVGLLAHARCCVCEAPWAWTETSCWAGSMADGQECKAILAPAVRAAIWDIYVA